MCVAFGYIFCTSLPASYMYMLMLSHTLRWYWQVLRRYACLWSMHKPVEKRPQLIVVNLMWTPKDDLASLKINGMRGAANHVTTA